MGEKEAVKNDGEKKVVSGGGDKKPDDGNVTVVLKMDLHCEGCAKKVKRAVKNFSGVDKVTADWENNKVTVTGKVDPSAVREKLEQKAKKKVELVSPKPAAKPDEKPPEKKQDDKKPAEDKKPKQSTVVLKIRLHCDGCISKIRRAIAKIKGVEGIEVDKDKNLVTVKGTMDAKELAPTLTKKLNRPVDVVPPKPATPAPADKKPEGGDKKPGGGDKSPEGGEKKVEKKDGGDAKPAAAAAPAAPAAAPKVEVNKLEYNWQAAAAMFWPAYDGPSPISAHNRYVMEAHAHQAFVNQNYANQEYANPHHGYVVPMDDYNSPQMCSDENPNACSIM